MVEPKRQTEKTLRSFGIAMAQFAAVATLATLLTTAVAATASSCTSGCRYGSLPLRFEENQGQADPSFRFLSRGEGYSLLLAPNEAVFLFRSLAEVKAGSRAGDGSGTGVLHMRLLGAAGEARAVPLDAYPGRSHYFTSRDEDSWRTGVVGYERVRFDDVYPGIDVLYYGRGSSTAGGDADQLEWDFVVSPGADPSVVAYDFDGVVSLRVDEAGNLLLELANGAFQLDRPVAYQQQGQLSGQQHGLDTRDPVEVGYRLLTPTRVGFEVAAYDATRELVIDPVLSYSTYLGGASADNGRAIVLDADGNAYVVGETVSVDFSSADSPSEPPLQAANAGGPNDVFVAKLDPTGRRLVYSTYLGGAGDDRAFSVAVDVYGNAYVTGRTSSTDFPLRNAVQPSFGGVIDAFVVVLDASGGALLSSTYLGGAADDRGLAIDVAPNGDIVVGGLTHSLDFPTANALQNAPAGLADGWVAKLSQAGPSLVYATYLGGAGMDNVRGLAVDGAGRATLVGDTASSDFPLANALQAVHGGGFDAYVAQLESDGAALSFSTFLGGSGDDFGMDIARIEDPDGDGGFALAGMTSSPDFPTQNAFQTAFGGALDAFVARLDATGSSFLYATYLGGSGTDLALSVAADPTGSLHVVGNTNSTDFPTVDPLQASNAGGFDNFISRVEPLGNGLSYSTYLGGGDSELSFDLMGVAADEQGNTYIAGITNSSDYPTARPFQAASGGGADTAVTRIGTGPEIELALTQSGADVVPELRLKNGGSATAEVELRLYAESTILASPLSLAVVPHILTIDPAESTEFVLPPLPAGLPFPGTELVARLIDPIRGKLLSESACSQVPCNE